MSEPSQNSPEVPRVDENETGLPFLRSWRSVYVAVTLVFIAYVVILTLLPRVYR